MSRNSTWTNPDGLIVGFGPHSKDDTVPRVFAGPGHVKTLSFEIQGTALELTTITSASFPPQAAKLKRGSRIVSAAFVPTQVFTSAGAATLTIGTYKDTSGDGTVTADDADGIDATVAITAIDAVGETVICDGALVNAAGVAGSVGAVSDSDVYIAAFAGTAAFTAGRGMLTITYVEPVYDATLYANDNVGPAF